MWANIGTGDALLFVAQTLSDAQKAQVKTNLGVSDEAVLFVSQSLTDNQKAVARGNIGLASALTYDAQALTAEQQDQARQNIGALAEETIALALCDALDEFIAENSIE